MTKVGTHFNNLGAGRGTLGSCTNGSRNGLRGGDGRGRNRRSDNYVPPRRHDASANSGILSPGISRVFASARGIAGNRLARRLLAGGILVAAVSASIFAPHEMWNHVTGVRTPP